jgi:hypothetical protein
MTTTPPPPWGEEPSLQCTDTIGAADSVVVIRVKYLACYDTIGSADVSTRRAQLTKLETMFPEKDFLIEVSGRGFTDVVAALDWLTVEFTDSQFGDQ